MYLYDKIEWTVLWREGVFLKKISITKRILILGIVQLAFLLMIFLVVVTILYRETKSDIIRSSENLLELYVNDIDSRLQDVEIQLNEFLYQNGELTNIESDNEARRVYGALNVRDQLGEMLAISSHIQIVVVAETEHDVCVDAAKEEVSASALIAVREFTTDYARGESRTAQWRFAEIAGVKYMYKAYRWNSRVVAAYIPVKEIMEFGKELTLDDQAFALSDGSGTVWDITGDYSASDAVVAEGDAAADHLESVSAEIRSRVAYMKEISVVPEQAVLTLYIRDLDIIGNVQLSLVIMLLLLAVCAVYTAILVRYTRAELLRPMTELTGLMTRISQGDYKLRARENYSSREFGVLAQTFNRLMDEILKLRIQRYEKQIELKDTELRCVRLTLRPHFFLNAMTTISGLSMQNKNKEIETYVRTFSKTIRYMFRAGLYTVPVKEEIAHVENYCEMQELKHPGCVFLYTDMSAECENWMIPQLIIHTLIENEYKYAVNPERMLTILIRISMQNYDGENMLSIEVEDDGKGYPPQILEQINGNPDKDAEEKENTRKEEGTRVGLWSIRKILYLMYGRSDLFHISNLEPHGCRNRILVPEKAVNELREEKEVQSL